MATASARQGRIPHVRYHIPPVVDWTRDSCLYTLRALYWSDCRVPIDRADEIIAAVDWYLSHGRLPDDVPPISYGTRHRDTHLYTRRGKTALLFRLTPAYPPTHATALADAAETMLWGWPRERWSDDG